jgi:hypothetical protein
MLPTALTIPTAMKETLSAHVILNIVGGLEISNTPKEKKTPR